jgi:transcriptional regulator with XRE-family HTH domain
MRWTSETFGRRLAQIRTDRRLTQQQLGVAVGKSKPTICHWENDPFFEVCESDAKKCAQALHCRLGDLLAPLNAPIPSDPRLKRRRRRSARLPPHPIADHHLVDRLLKQLTYEMTGRASQLNIKNRVTTQIPKFR